MKYHTYYTLRKKKRNLPPWEEVWHQDQHQKPVETSPWQFF
jgi:hypothetical protein